MAKPSLSDRVCSINSNEDLSSLTRIDWVDHIETYLAKSQALIRLALHQGLDAISAADQFHFCLIVDEMLEEVRKGFEILHHPLPT